MDVAGEDRDTLILNLLLDARLVVCDALIFSAVTLLLNGSYVKGIMQLHKSYKLSEETVKRFGPHKARLHPELVHGMNFDVGFFLFALSIIPTKYLKFVQLAGFRADREEGLRLIREVYAASKLRRCFAMLLLLYNDVLVPRGISDVSTALEEATGICAQATAQYPTGSVWRVMAAQTAKKRLDLEAAKEHFKVCLEVSAVLGKVPTLLAYEYASLHAMTLDYDRAVQLLEPILKEPPFKMYTTAAAQLSGCYVLRGERERAVAIWKDIAARFAKSSSATDLAIVKLFNSYTAGAGGHFVFFEILYFRRDLPKMASLGSRLLDALNTAAQNAKIIDVTGAFVPPSSSSPSPPPQQQQPSQPSSSKGFSFKGLVKSIGKSSSSSSPSSDSADYTEDNRAVYLLMKAVILKAIRAVDDAEAVGILEGIAKMGPATLRLRWQRPYALYELCESYSKAGLLDKAAEALKKCIELKDYPWEDPLKVRIRVTTEQLNKLSAAQISDDISNSTSPANKPLDDDDDDDDSDGAIVDSTSPPPPPRPPKPSK